ANCDMGELGFLVVRDDPDIVRHDGDDLRPGMDVLPDADVAFTDFAASRGGYAGIAEIDFDQIELRLGLLDGRSLGRELSEIAVDIALFCEPVEHLLRALSIRMDNAELGRTLDQVCLRLEDRRKGLIEI